MQAHPLSILAARIPFQYPPSSQSATPSRDAVGLHHRPEPDPRPSPQIQRFAVSAPGIAQGSGLAHDAGNLLGALGLYCDLLRAPGVLSPEHRHYATELGLISSRSSDLIRRLLALSPAEPQPPAPALNALTPPAISLHGTARLPETDHSSVLRKLTPVLQCLAAGIATVSVSSPAILPPFDLPAEALERITVNLVRNAVEAIRKQQDNRPAGTPRTHGEIRVALALIADRLQLTVDDNGPGVPPPVAAAFLHPTPLPPNSTRGLGHRIVHELVTSAGGRISIRTLSSQGTVFSMSWPLPSARPFASTLSPTALHPACLPVAQEGPASC